MDILKGHTACTCGKYHNGLLDAYIIENNAVARTAEFVKQYGRTKAFLLADENTFDVAGEQVVRSLEQAGISYCKYIFPTSPKPDETADALAIAICHAQYGGTAIKQTLLKREG